MRLVMMAVAFACGDAAAVSTGVRPTLTALAAATLTLAAAAIATAVGLGSPVARRNLRRAIGLAAMALLGLARGGQAARPPPLAPALAAALDADAARVVTGTISRGPEPNGSGCRFIVRIRDLDGRPAAGTVALSIVAGQSELAPGESVRFATRLRAVRGTSNPGVPDPVLALRAAGVDALASLPTSAAVARSSGPADVGPRRLAHQAHRALRAAIDRVLAGAPAAFLRTAVLGERQGVADDVEEGFRAAGATHVLSVSGLHLAAVASLLFLLVRTGAARIPRLPLVLDPRAVAAAVSLPAIGFFTLLTGEAVATERSALMLGLGLVALLVGRRARPGPTIAGAALILLAAEPLQLFDVSFQLSVASVSGIALCARGLAAGRPARESGIWRRALGWLARFGAATLAATAATGPLVAHWFGEVTPAAPLGNLALVPLVELGVVPLGLAGAAAGAIWAPLGRWPLWLAGGAARLALAIAGLFRAHAPVWLCRAPNALETGCATAAGVLALIAVARGDLRRAGGWAAVGCLTATITSLVVRDLARRHRDALVITFLDVGQGDAAVVEAPGGAAMVIDGGGSRDGTFDTGARIVEPFLRARGIGRLEVVALSHPHPDHLNGLFRILQRFAVGAFWSSGDDGRNPEYRRLIALARANGIPLPAVTPRPLGGAWIDPLAPDVGGTIAPPEGLTVNDASLVLRIALGRRAALFPGDLEADGEGELAGRRSLGQPVAADVLKVPHHGSRTSSTDELLDAVGPRLAVMSLGWHNQFHFPAPEVMARYAARGIRILRTDRDGAITVTIHPDGAIGIACARGCPTQPALGATEQLP